MTAKRILDLALASISILLLSPLFAFLTLLVYLNMRSPILFRQRRPGLNEKPFYLMKFRTMTDAKGANGTLLPDGQRLTRVGLFLRATSLDELPQLFNVLRGI
jgi:lipopolysaccharide/colanic/teichoic acid biosynthesis glycosyltransferase